MSRRKAKPKVKTIPGDSAAHLKTDEDIAHYPEAVFDAMPLARGHIAQRRRHQAWIASINQFVATAVARAVSRPEYSMAILTA